MRNMKLTEKKFNLWFSIFLLAGMIAVVVIDTAFEIQNLDARLAMQLIAGFGAVMGVVNTVLSANGNIWTFVFGFIDVVCCSIVYLDSGIMGTFALHVFYFLPMQFIGWWQWSKRGAKAMAEINEDGERETAKVRARRMTGKQWAYLSAALLVGIAVSYAALYYIDLAKFNAGRLAEMDKAKILLDATVVTLNILGQVLMSMAFMEQWYIWNLVNVFSILLWTNRLAVPDAGGYALVMVIKYVFYLLNSINGLRIWLHLSRNHREMMPQKKHGCC